jgi:hypothetical protein
LVLGKSLYYARNYAGSAEAPEEGTRLWEMEGGVPSVFEKLYLEQCRSALAAGLGSVTECGYQHDNGASLWSGKSVMSHRAMSVVSCVKEGRSLTNIPKLKPRQFVSREKVRAVLRGSKRDGYVSEYSTRDFL